MFDGVLNALVFVITARAKMLAGMITKMYNALKVHDTAENVDIAGNMSDAYDVADGGGGGNSIFVQIEFAFCLLIQNRP